MSGSSIRFKRGKKADLPKSASSGTPLWCEDSNELYVGTGEGVAKVGVVSNETDTSSTLSPVGISSDDPSTLKRNTSVTIKGGTVTAQTFVGDFSGNATSATKDSKGNNIAETYLPKSGGTVTGTLDLTKTTDLSGTANNSPALRIGNVSGEHLELDGNEIHAKASGTTVSTLNLNIDGGDINFNTNTNKVSISGGKLTTKTLESGASKFTGAVSFANNTLNNVGDDVQIGDVNKVGCLGIKGVNGNTGIIFKPYSGSTDQTVTTNGSGTMSISGNVSVAGTLTNNGNTILNKYTINLSSYPATNFYPVFWQGCPDSLYCEVYSPSGVSSAAYNMNTITFILRTQGWTDVPHSLKILEYGLYTNTEICIMQIVRGTKTGGCALYLRGGLNYVIKSNRAPSLKTATFTNSEEVYPILTNYGTTDGTGIDVIWRADTYASYGKYSYFGGKTIGTFIGDVTGTASKATADANGNNIASTYLKKSEYLGFNLFDTKTIGHTLSGTEATGWAIAGTLVTNTYSTAVAKIKSLYDAGTSKTMTTPVILPTFFSNSQDNFVVSSSNNSTNMYGVFNGDYSQGNQLHSIGNYASAWVQLKYPYKTICKGYTIQADNATTPEYPTAWKLQGSNDGINWTDLDTKTGQSFTLNESKTFTISTTSQFMYYRMQFTAGNSAGELRYLHFDVEKVWFTYKLATDGKLIAPVSEKSNVDSFNTYENYCTPIYVWDSSNNRFYLPSSTNGKRVIKTWKNKTSWCRIWSDGWCEQGGDLPSYSSWQIAQISFHQEFIDTSYYVGLTSSWSDKGAAANLYYERKTTKSFDAILLSYNSASHGIGRWYACGYLKNPPQDVMKTYYCIGNTAVNLASIDVSKVLNDVNNLNTALTQINAKPYITQTYKNGTSWYRVWSDGWCEQGGVATLMNGYVTVNLLKTYKDTTYLPFVNQGHGTIVQGSFNTADIVATDSIKVSSFRILGSTNADGALNNTTANWYACGYIN